MTILHLTGLLTGVCLLLNLADSAHRTHAFPMTHSPYAPTAGVSPFVIRLAGLGMAAAGAAMLVESLG
ncbi:hypothetical protein ACGILS_00435 [Streptomyces albidoflavus]|uniref:hypothetical protein n=1 Tax=Streptomyces albidoflavus TaxID=1886 RepID=UPI00101E400A|nr:hypothetical protein [Streptomyces albidoflavus]MCU7706177.1 hypothetical protein [Streptomyces albidoflavus]RZD95805.1 hypothetical protein C0Q64_19650 [Streptomyces albidoflavus]RZD99765.1 hypothetical protein C0Q65_19885 [Streptomyces albidoflavus]